MADEAMTTMPTMVAAFLVAGHVDNLWQQWANEKDHPGCCTRHCAPCAALEALLSSGQLDELYGVYMDHAGGQSATWDPVRRRVKREWLLSAWQFGGTACNCEKADMS